MVEIKTGSTCPLLKKPCIKLECMWFMKLTGTDNNTGKLIEDWDCSIKWIPMLLVENSNMQRQTGAAVESFRNEVVKQNGALASAMLIGIEGKNND